MFRSVKDSSLAEYDILELLSLRNGVTISKEMFLNQLYGGIDEPEIKIIDVFISKLRKRLADASNGKDYIVWGRGYMLREPDQYNVSNAGQFRRHARLRSLGTDRAD
jgi:DNA-binding response OmpR family regulator